MLQDIRLHIEQDEERQVELEQQLSQHIDSTHRQSVEGFRRYIPSLLPLVRKVETQNIGVFCNKFAELNLVDYGAGRALYGFHPRQEISQQLALQMQRASYISFDAPPTEKQNPENENQLSELTAYQRLLNSEAMPENAEVLVVLGLGIGSHIQQLVENYSVAHIIIYEPEVQYFQASTMVESWQDILSTAAKKGISLYLQIGKDGRDILSDIQELRAQITADGFYLYKHYNHSVFNAISIQLQQKSWQQLLEHGLRYDLNAFGLGYMPNWQYPADVTSLTNLNAAHEVRLQKNLQAFKHYFPNIYQEFKEYKPRDWLPVSTPDGEVNLFHKATLSTWSGESPRQDAQQNFDNFCRYPNRDGLVLGYKGKKLRHYLHYQFVNQTESLLENEEEIGQLPEKVKSLILFGLGLGYQLESLFDQHTVEKLFLCEPNRDFFYASLYAIDWQHILTTVDKAGARLYINVGDDGTNLFRDLLNQFYAIGPYVLANTYFYQSYYNANLVSAVAQLREQLQVVISMGEYFDHAYFGISHTLEGLKRSYRHLVHTPSQYLDNNNKDVPVFVVGNGPSLDYSIDAIKEYQDRAIIVSCGTSLQVLYRNGIIPDFHAEIEQNRSTYDWAMRLGSLSYLKKINLISCNGIHPDTCNLYKDVFVAFKEGESSTVSSLNVLGQEKFHALAFSFPTVSNFVIDLFTTLGFNQLYLIGVDLGFIDVEHHHSKSSGYYDDGGEPLIDYKDSNFTGLVVEGNFLKTVNTKHEFKVSKMVIEDKLRYVKCDCFNTSNGAKILGAVPLRIDDVLIVSSSRDKDMALQTVQNKAFVEVHGSSFEKNVLQKYSKTLLLDELDSLVETISRVPDYEQQAIAMVDNVKNQLFRSYQKGQSLLFYYLYGTSNYANALMIKMLNKVSDSELVFFNQARELWLDCLKKIAWKIADEHNYFDVSSSFINQRTQSYFQQLRTEEICFVTDQAHLNHMITIFKEANGLKNRLAVLNNNEYEHSRVSHDAKNILYISELNEDSLNKNILQAQWSLIVVDSQYKRIKQLKLDVPVLFICGDFRKPGHPASCHPMFSVYLAFAYAICSPKIKVMIPKFLVTSIDEIPSDFGMLLSHYDYVYDCGRVIGFANEPLDATEMLMSNGARAIRLHTPVEKSKFVQMLITVKQAEGLANDVYQLCPFLRKVH